MRMYPGISIVTLGVADVGRSSRFYERFGWRRSKAASDDTASFFALNNIVIAVSGREAPAGDSGTRRDAAGLLEPAIPRIILTQNYGSPAAVDLAFDLAIAAGAKELAGPGNAPWGGYHGFFADPGGHIWELAYHPFLELAADGTLDLPP